MLRARLGSRTISADKRPASDFVQAIPRGWEEEDWLQAWDDVKGCYRKGIYEYVTVEECIRYTGFNPTSMRRVDANNGPKRNRAPGAACTPETMPPLEAKKIPFVKTAGRYGEWQRGKEGTYWEIVHRRTEGAPGVHLRQRPCVRGVAG